MNQNIWGPHLWFSLHTISFVYPLKPTPLDKTNYKNTFEDLKNVIPCTICKKNYIRHLIEHPIDSHLNNRKDLVYWVIDIHNMVNAETGKKILSYDTVMKKYKSVYKKNINLEIENEEYNDEHNNDEHNNNEHNNENILYYNNNYNNNYLSGSNLGKYNYIIISFFIFFIILLIINFCYMFFYSSKSKNN